MTDDIERVLYTKEQISEAVTEMGKRISGDYKDKNLLLISVLKGSVIFMSDLMRAITIPCCIDFMATSSYGSGVTSSGAVKITKDLDISIEGYDVLVVEDILDSGRTLAYLKEILLKRNPKSFRICTLFDKPERRTANINADYFALKIPNEFVVGYGLDYNEKYRNLPDICILKPEVIK